MELFKGGISRGKYGYMDYRRKNLLIKAIISAAFAALFIVLGLIIFNTEKNYLMIPGMLMVLPFANFAASYFSVMKYRTADIEKYTMVKNYDDCGMLLCDLAVVTETGKRMYAEFAVVYKGGIVMYGSDKKWKTNDMETHFNQKLRARGLNIRLKAYHDFDEFLTRINAVDPADANDDAGRRREELARETVINSCM